MSKFLNLVFAAVVIGMLAGCDNSEEYPYTPPPPSSLWIVPLSPRGIELRFSDEAYAMRYDVERAFKDSAYQRIGTVDGTIFRFVDSTLDRSREYTYRVRAWRAYDKDASSSPISIRFGTSHKLLRYFETPENVKDLFSSPDGALLGVLHSSGVVSLWRIGSGIWMLPVDRRSSFVPQFAGFANNGQWLWLAGSDRIEFLSSSDGNVIRTVKMDSVEMRTCIIPPQGDRAVTADTKGRLQIRDLTDGSVRRTLAEDSTYRWTLTMSGNGSRFAATATAHTEVWDVASEQRVYQTYNSAYNSTLSPDGSLLAIRLHPGVRVFHVPDESMVFASSLNNFGAIDISPDNRMLLAMGTDAVQLLEIPGGRMIGTLYVANWSNVQFLPDGQSFCTYSGYDKTVLLWSVTQEERWVVAPYPFY